MSHGGERGIRTLEGSKEPTRSRPVVAKNAAMAIAAVARCTLLHAGIANSFFAEGRRTLDGTQYVIGLRAVNCNTGDLLAEVQEKHS
jgi:hypothetical protein